MNLHAHLQSLPPVAVIYVDLDGTLLGAGGSVLTDARGRPSLASVTALVQARQAGIAVVAASGRRVEQLVEDVTLLGLDGGIAEAGGVWLGADGPDMLWGECPPSDAASPRQALADAGALALVMASADGPVRPYLPWDEGRVAGYLLHGRIDVAAANRRLIDGGVDWAHVVDNGLTAGWPEEAPVRSYHLICRGVGKAAGVAADLRRRALDGSQAMAIGDSLEDRSMADVVGTYVAVAGGHGRDGSNCFHSEFPNGAGVADAITAAVRRSAPDGREPG